jgi:hypothetical protein
MRCALVRAACREVCVCCVWWALQEDMLIPDGTLSSTRYLNAIAEGIAVGQGQGVGSPGSRSAAHGGGGGGASVGDDPNASDTWGAARWGVEGPDAVDAGSVDGGGGSGGGPALDHAEAVARMMAQRSSMGDDSAKWFTALFSALQVRCRFAHVARVCLRVGVSLGNGAWGGCLLGKVGPVRACRGVCAFCAPPGTGVRMFV